MKSIFEYRMNASASGNIVGVPPVGNPELGGNGNSDSSSVSPAQVGVWFFLGTVLMLFGGFISAYLVRRTTGNDWGMIPLPPMLWMNTVVLAISSITLELSRRAIQGGNTYASKKWMWITVGLGALFVVGQSFVWSQLSAAGVFLPDNPHSSFFYILTGAHALHVIGGLTALTVAAFRFAKVEPVTRKQQRIAACSTYWHFFGALWVVLLVTLFML